MGAKDTRSDNDPMSWRDGFLELLAWPLQLAAYAIWVIIILFPVYRAYFWLKTGYWFSYTLLDALTYLGFSVPLPGIQWASLRKIASDFINFQLEIALIIGLLSAFAIVKYIASKIGARGK
jgi:hypothetical protein